jgi:hypothetical protein
MNREEKYNALVRTLELYDEYEALDNSLVIHYATATPDERLLLKGWRQRITTAMADRLQDEGMDIHAMECSLRIMDMED